MPDRPDPNPILGGAVSGGDWWNQFAQANAGGAIDHAQNNPFSQMAQNYMGQQLSGSMQNNPFMNTLYNTLQGSSMDEANNYLRGFLGSPNGGDGFTTSGGSGYRGGGGGTISKYAVRAGGGGQPGGETPPDTVGNSNSYFAQRVKELFDPARLDPANDPTMAPFIAAMRRENQENTLSNLSDISARMEGAGRYGGSLYAALDRGAREEGIESLDSAMSQAMLQSREAALARQMEGLGQINTRDLGAMQDATQRYGIDAQSSAAGAGAAAAAADAEQGRRLQAIQMMMQGGQFGLGLMGDMANTMNANQLGVLNAGLGYGQLGQQGYQNAAQMGQLGLGGLQLGAGIGTDIMHLNSAEAQAAANARAEEARWNWQRQMEEQQAQQDALNSYLNILMGVGGMGYDQTGTSPGQYVDPGLGSAAPWMAGAGSLMDSYGSMGNLWNQGTGNRNTGNGYIPSASRRGAGDIMY